MIYEFLTEKMKIITTSTKNDKLSTKNVKLIINCRVRIIFSEVIDKDLGRSSNSSRVWGSAVRPPWGIGAKMLSKCKKIVYSLTLFGVRYK